ncbi:hypothetical protein Rsub_01659 [Raphidocelis subcapitata]|uniref:R3H domain-containing protein n=1 Tax=Raphidocelis subcapitata TaxID=307507 RepID=A0A2V0NML2_9CHLO|nr:hypothetical protein Rsub_01659 [Raphidocelis subcapitata]|eukprot:GBF88758.1 hypothetical protein Rsub_01659 [Raphidocelis subcapitata]
MQPAAPQPRQRSGPRAPLPGQRGPGAAPRTLGDLGSLYCNIRVDYTRGGPVEAHLAACPDPHEPLGADGAPEDPAVASVVLQSPAHPDADQIRELLAWFTSAAETGAGDGHAALALPASCTKAQRAAWHKAAEGVGLHSESTGFGDGRHLRIYSHTAWRRVRAAAAAAGAEGQGQGQGQGKGQAQAEARRGRGGDRELRARAKQLWSWCQTEGLFNYSQGELQQLLASGAQLPADIAAVVEKRNVAARLFAALNAGDEAGALAAIAEDPKACWLRDDTTGGYPAHVAAFFGLDRALRTMVAANAPTLLEQRDARRMTPLSVAREAGRAGAAAAIAEMMQEAGLAAAAAAASPGGLQGRGSEAGRGRGAGTPGRGGRAAGPAGVGAGRGREQQDGQAEAAAGGAVDGARPPRPAAPRALSPGPQDGRPPSAAPGSPPAPAPPQPLLPTAGERGFTRQRTASPRVAGVLAAAEVAVLTKPPPPPPPPEDPTSALAKGGKARFVTVRLEVQPNNAARPVRLVLQVAQPGSKSAKPSGAHVVARLIVSEAAPGQLQPARPVRLMLTVVGSGEKAGSGRGGRGQAQGGRSGGSTRGQREPQQGSTQAQGRGQRQAHDQQQRRQSGQQAGAATQAAQEQQQQQQQDQAVSERQYSQQQYAQAHMQAQLYQQQLQQLQLMAMGVGIGQAPTATGVALQQAARSSRGQQHPQLHHPQQQQQQQQQYQQQQYQQQQYAYANPNQQQQQQQQQEQQYYLHQMYLQQQQQQQQQFYAQQQVAHTQQQHQQQQMPQYLQHMQPAAQPAYHYQQPRSHQRQKPQGRRGDDANGNGGRQ